MPLPGFQPVDPERASRIGQVKDWVRAALGLPPEAHVMVTELQCREEGCPPIETVLAVLGDCCPGKYKIHKPVLELTRQDVIDLLGQSGSHTHH